MALNSQHYFWNEGNEVTTRSHPDPLLIFISSYQSNSSISNISELSISIMYDLHPFSPESYLRIFGIQPDPWWIPQSWFLPIIILYLKSTFITFSSPSFGPEFISLCDSSSLDHCVLLTVHHHKESKLTQPCIPASPLLGCKWDGYPWCQATPFAANPCSVHSLRFCLCYSW